MFCRIWFLALVCTKILSRKINTGTCSRIESVISDTGVVNRTTYFCCRHYEDINGECQACKEGFTSDGTKCLPCEDGRYGTRCSYICACANFERCDRVKGCILNAENLITTLIGFTWYTTEPGVVTKKDSSDGTYNPKEIIIYCLLIACLVLIMTLCIVVNKYKLKSRRESLSKHQHINSPENVIILEAEKSNSIEIQDSIYHFIDESKIVDVHSCPKESKTCLEDQRSSSESESQDIQCDEPSEYLHPYNTLAVDGTTDEHPYDKRRINETINCTS